MMSEISETISAELVELLTAIFLCHVLLIFFFDFPCEVFSSLGLNTGGKQKNISSPVCLSK